MVQAIQRCFAPRAAASLLVAVLSTTAVLDADARQTDAAAAELERARTALEKYRDPILAVHDGYFSTLGCIEIGRAGGPGEMPYRPGGMGIHFLNLQLLDTTLDPERPQVLIYEPDEEGRLHLVAAEWFVPLALGVTERPRLFGQPFDGPMAGHHPLMPHELHHYDLHVWLFKDNPYGMFAATNPAVECGGFRYTVVEDPPPLVRHQDG